MNRLRRQERSRQRVLEAAIGWAALVAAPASGPEVQRSITRNRNGTPVEVEVIVRLARPGELDVAPPTTYMGVGERECPT